MRYLFYSILAFIIIGCEQQINWNLKTQTPDYIVVDAMISNRYNGLKIADTAVSNYVKIQYPRIDMSREEIPLSNANVNIIAGENIYSLKESSENSGIYISDTLLTASVGKEYLLQIEKDDRTYTGITSMVPLYDYGFMEFEKLEEDDETYQLTSGYYSEEPTMLRIDLDWSHVPIDSTSEDTIRKAVLQYYYLNNYDINHLLPPNQETVTFPKGTKIEQRIYSLTKEHAAFIRSLLIETHWRGAIFDVQHANVTTNMSEGAKGYFGAVVVEMMDTVAIE